MDEEMIKVWIFPDQASTLSIYAVPPADVQEGTDLAIEISKALYDRFKAADKEYHSALNEVYKVLTFSKRRKDYE